jgi:hypothetical protein
MPLVALFVFRLSLVASVTALITMALVGVRLLLLLRRR